MELTRKIQDTIKEAIEREYNVSHTCEIDNDKLYFRLQDCSKLEISILIKVESK